MRLSIFTTVTDPVRRGEHYNESLACYRDLADEVVVVNGGGQITNHLDVNYINYKWLDEFKWDFIGQQFQRGYLACTGDWVIHADLDFLFHPRDFGKIRQALNDYPNAPAISFYKWQFILPDKYNLKSRLLIAVNKRVYDKRIKFNGGGDLCQPTFDGYNLNLDEMPQAGVPFYNYEKLTKTKEQIMDDVGRMDRAYKQFFGEWLYSTDGTNESAYLGWYEMVRGRYLKPQEKIALTDHPEYIQNVMRNLKPEQFGYNGFGLKEGKVYA